MIPVFRGVIKDNSFKLNDYEKARFGKYLKGLNDGHYQIVLSKLKKPRSLKENDYFHAVVCTVLGEWSGEANLGQVKNGLRQKDFWPKKESKLFGTVPMSSADLSTVEFEKLMEDIRRWALVDHDVYIPLPNEVQT